MTKTTVEIIDKIDGRLQEVIDGISSLATEHGPNAVALGLDVVRLKGLGGLMIGFVMLVVAAVTAAFTVKFLRLFKADDNEGWEFASMGTGLVSFVTSLIALAHLLDIWAWVAIFYPAAYLAKKVLGL